MNFWVKNTCIAEKDVTEKWSNIVFTKKSVRKRTLCGQTSTPEWGRMRRVGATGFSSTGTSPLLLFVRVRPHPVYRRIFYPNTIFPMVGIIFLAAHFFRPLLPCHDVSQSQPIRNTMMFHHVCSYFYRKIFPFSSEQKQRESIIQTDMVVNVESMFELFVSNQISSPIESARDIVKRVIGFEYSDDKIIRSWSWKIAEGSLLLSDQSVLFAYIEALWI